MGAAGVREWIWDVVLLVALCAQGILFTGAIPVARDIDPWDESCYMAGGWWENVAVAWR